MKAERTPQQEPTIFGYSWDQIRRAQQGERLTTSVPVSTATPSLRPGDIELLEKHGRAGLERLEFFGVIDRLVRSGKL